MNHQKFMSFCVSAQSFLLLLFACARVCAFVINIYLSYVFVCASLCIRSHYKYMTIDKRNNKFNCMWSHNLLRRQFRPVCASFKNDTQNQIQTDFFNKNVYKRAHTYRWGVEESLFAHSILCVFAFNSAVALNASLHCNAFRENFNSIAAQ